jgi:hypothetical protein
MPAPRAPRSSRAALTLAPHCRDPAARRLLLPLLPLVFHPLSSMRRAAARLLALAAFGPEARRWHGYGAAAAAAAPAASAAAWSLVPPGGSSVLLPAPFAGAFKFPFRVTPISVAAATPGSGASRRGEECAKGAARPTNVAARRLVLQQRLLRPARGDAAAARRLLDEPPPGAGAPPALLHATAATLATLDASALAQAALAAVSVARSHAEAARALRALQRLCSSAPGLAAVLAAPWGEALGRLLGTAPVTREDQELWLELLPLVERLLLGGRWQEVGCGRATWGGVGQVATGQ